MDKLAALRAFCRVVEREQFTAAARDLGVSNAWVSKTIRALEEELGTPLLVRTTRQLHLTEAGRAYYERSLSILEAVDEADQLARDAGASPRGTLRISAPMSLGLVDLNTRLLRFADRYAELSLDLRLDDRYVDLVGGGFDVALRGGGALPDSSMRARQIAPLTRHVCASPAYLRDRGTPRTPADLTGHHCLVYTLAREPGVWRFVRDGQEEVVQIGGRYRVNSSIALRDAAIAGQGVALLPGFAVRDALDRGELVALLEAWPPREVALHAVYPAHREQSQKVRLLIDFLIADYATDGRGSGDPATARVRGTEGIEEV